MGLVNDISESGIWLAASESDLDTVNDSKLVNHFKSKLLSAQYSRHGKCPWVLVTSMENGQTLLSVYTALKTQGVFDQWSRQTYDVRREAGICVLALMP